MASAKVRAEVLRKLLRAGARSRIERLVDRLHPPDIAAMLTELAPEEARAVVDVLFSAHRAARTLRELPGELLPRILDLLQDKQIARCSSACRPTTRWAFSRCCPRSGGCG